MAGPSRLSVRNASSFVRLAPDHLHVVYTGRSSFGDCGTCQAEAPIPASCSIFYFEMLIVRGGRDSMATIGLTTRLHELGKQPGTCRASAPDGHASSPSERLLPGKYFTGLSYRGAGGCLFDGVSSDEDVGSNFGPRFGVGDAIGCGLLVAEQRAFFTLNGKLAGSAVPVPAGHLPLFPTISVHAPGDCVKAIFKRPFCFDLSTFVSRLRSKALKATASANRIPPSIPASLIQEYLLRHAEVAALRALQGSLTPAEVSAEGLTAARVSSSHESRTDPQLQQAHEALPRHHHASASDLGSMTTAAELGSSAGACGWTDFCTDWARETQSSDSLSMLGTPSGIDVAFLTRELHEHAPPALRESLLKYDLGDDNVSCARLTTASSSSSASASSVPSAIGVQPPPPLPHASSSTVDSRAVNASLQQTQPIRHRVPGCPHLPAQTISVTRSGHDHSSSALSMASASEDDSAHSEHVSKHQITVFTPGVSVLAAVDESGGIPKNNEQEQYSSSLQSLVPDSSAGRARVEPTRLDMLAIAAAGLSSELNAEDQSADPINVVAVAEALAHAITLEQEGSAGGANGMSTADSSHRLSERNERVAADSTSDEDDDDDHSEEQTRSRRTGRDEEGCVIAGLLPAGMVLSADSPASDTASHHSDESAELIGADSRFLPLDGGIRATGNPSERYHIARSVAIATGVEDGGGRTAMNWSQNAHRVRDSVNDRARRVDSARLLPVPVPMLRPASVNDILEDESSRLRALEALETEAVPLPESRQMSRTVLPTAGLDTEELWRQPIPPAESSHRTHSDASRALSGGRRRDRDSTHDRGRFLMSRLAPRRRIPPADAPGMRVLLGDQSQEATRRARSRVREATDGTWSRWVMRTSETADGEEEPLSTVPRRANDHARTTFNPTSPAGMRLRASLATAPAFPIPDLRIDRPHTPEIALRRRRRLSENEDSLGSELEADALSTSSDDDDAGSDGIPIMAPYRSMAAHTQSMRIDAPAPSPHDFRLLHRQVPPLQTDDEIAEILISGNLPSGLQARSRHSHALRVPGVHLAATHTDDSRQADASLTVPASLIASNNLNELRCAIQRQARLESSMPASTSISGTPSTGFAMPSGGASLISAPAAALLDTCLIPSASLLTLGSRHPHGISIDPSPMLAASESLIPPPLSLGPARLAEVRNAALHISQQQASQPDTPANHRVQVPVITVPAVPLTPLLAPLNPRNSDTGSRSSSHEHGTAHVVPSSIQHNGPIRSRFGAKAFLRYSDVITSLKASLTLRSRVSHFIASGQVDQGLELLQDRVPFIFAACIRATQIARNRNPKQQQQVSRHASALSDDSAMTLLIELHCARAAIAVASNDRESALCTLRDCASPLLSVLTTLRRSPSSSAKSIGSIHKETEMHRLTRLIRDTALLVSGLRSSSQVDRIASPKTLLRLSRRCNDLIVNHYLLMRVQRRMAERLLSISQSSRMRRIPSIRRRRSSIPHPSNTSSDVMPPSSSSSSSSSSSAAAAAAHGSTSMRASIPASSSTPALIDRLVSLSRLLSGRPSPDRHHTDSPPTGDAGATPIPRTIPGLSSSLREDGTRVHRSTPETHASRLNDQSRTHHRDSALASDRVAEASLLLQLMRKPVELAAPPPVAAIDTALQQLLLVQELLRVSAGSVGPRFVLPSALDARNMMHLREQ